MSNIRKAFENGKAFVPFITCGDPDLESTKRNVRAAVAAGADLIELGIPFSESDRGRPRDSGGESACALGRCHDGQCFQWCANSERNSRHRWSL